MKVEKWPLTKIKPYPGNPRCNDKAVESVAKSIQEFGFQQPLVVDTQGEIIVGHTRFKAARKLKLKEVPVVVADRLTPEQIKAYRLADNRTGELALWDFKELTRELDEIKKDFQIEMKDFGFDQEGFLSSGQDKTRQEPVVPELYQVVIECRDEEEQKHLWEELIAQGRKCRLLNL